MVRCAKILEQSPDSLCTNRNLALSFIAGNATIWKPSPSTPLCSIAVTKIVAEVLEKNGIHGAAAGLVTGDNHIGDALCENEHVTLGEYSF
jgi:aldehyde dehydrogenase family 7 protein A1